MEVDVYELIHAFIMGAGTAVLIFIGIAALGFLWLCVLALGDAIMSVPGSVKKCYIEERVTFWKNLGIWLFFAALLIISAI